MQPQRPKRLPTDFFDRLLTDQTDDQINDLLSTLVDEQISPSVEAEKDDVSSEPAMIFEPAEPPTVTRELPHAGMEESIVGSEEELDAVSELEPERPVDNLIPPSTQMRTTGNLADTIIEPEIPTPPITEPTDEELGMMFPGVPEDPSLPVVEELPDMGAPEPTGSDDLTPPPIAAPEEEAFPGLESFEIPSEPPTAGANILDNLAAATELQEDEVSGLTGSSSPPVVEPATEEIETPISDTAQIEDLFGITEVEAPTTEEDSISAPTVEESQEPEPIVAAAPTEKILSHKELIHARNSRRWQHPKRRPKSPKMAISAPEVAIDQTKLSALDDYLQDRHKTGEAIFLSRIQKSAIWFLLPAFIAFSLFSWYPMLKGLFLSFFNFQPTGESIFIGLQNYTRAFKDLMFLKTLWHGGLFCSLALILGFVPPIFLSIFINEFRRGKSLIKFLFFLPFLMPTVPAAILWKWIMDQGYGLLNAVISLLPIADPHIGWLTNPNLAMLSIVLLYVWKNTGWAMLIYTAALVNIDTTLYEEAEIHGATISQKVRYITLPTIRTTIAVMFIITIINTIQLFTEVYIMTNGGPMNSTEVLATYIYKQAFFYMDIGYASALSILMLVMLLVITIFRLRRLD